MFIRPMAGLIAAAAALSGCGGSAPAHTTSPSSSITRQAVLGTVIAEVKDTKAKIVVRAEPSKQGKVITTLAGATDYGTRRVLGYRDSAPGGSWYHVSLPTRPNGAHGWVEAPLFNLVPARDRIVVKLSKHTITVTVGGKAITGQAAIGTKAHPTPTTPDNEPAYVTDLIDTKKPTGPFGRWAAGVSLHSVTLTEFGGGDGQIGIHGTGDDSVMGQDVTHGCVRVPDRVEEALGKIQVGSPVVIMK